LKKILKKILIIRFGAIGDVILSTVIAAAIKAKHPNCEVHFLSFEATTELLKCCPYIDRAISYENAKNKDYRYLVKKGLELRKEGYDAVFNLTNALKNQLLSRLISLNTKDKGFKSNLHAALEFLQCAKKAFPDVETPEKLTLLIDDETKERVKKLAGLEDNKFTIALNPGGGNNTVRQGRILNRKKWIELANRLNEEFENAQIVVTGGFNEAEMHKTAFSQVLNAKVMTGILTLKETAALFSLSNIVISIDSGPMHIASAVNDRVIGIFGSTPPAKYAPFGGFNNVVSADEKICNCKFCFKKKCPKLRQGEIFTPCMEGVAVDDIIKKVKEVI